MVKKRALAQEIGHGAAIGSHRIGSLGDGTAHHDIVAAGLASLLGGHDALLIAHIAVSKADTGGDGQEVLTAAAVDLAGFQGGADDAVQTCVLAVSA